jgi:fructose-specific component phosphotransferase system IIB-like protein
MLRTIIASTVSSAVKTHTNKGYVGTFSRAVLAMLLLGLGSILVVTTPGSVAGAQGAAVSFDQPKQIVGTPNQDAEPPQIAASGKNVYIIWHEFPEETAIQPDVFLARSTNHGKDFGARKNLSNSADIDSSNERIATSGHKVFVVWSENADEIFFRRSTNRGENFDSAKKLSISPGATLPQVAVSGKNVFVVWQAPDQNGISDIFFTQSSDEGRNFDIEENISNNDGESEFRDHGLRQIAVSGDKVIVT